MSDAPSPEVSLIMPVWRPRREWLRSAVQSVLEEDGCDVELVVVDDGNDQPVAELLDDIHDPRLRILRVDHGGAYTARNTGLDVARGSWVRFVDADDVVERHSTARLLALTEGAGDVIAYGTTLMCDEELNPEAELGSDIQGRADEACVLAAFDVRVVSMLFSRSLLERAGTWDPSFAISGDWDYVLRALEHGRVRGERATATYYRRHAASLTKAANVAAGEEAWQRILDGYFGRHPEKQGSELERRARRTLLLDRAAAYAHVRQRRRALARLLQAGRLDPSAALRLALRLGRDELKRLLR
ncbi:MAG: hypothetical protein QOH73_1035 [Gaiellaceae bacterium]|jgi:succinoglycan biosynthesis protein ExoO|nr:hypothetical protein [Gaiellaceae bacterium]